MAFPYDRYGLPGPGSARPTPSSARQMASSASSAMSGAAVGSVLGPIGTALGTALGFGVPMITQHMANKENRAAAERQMQFQEQMSSTAYQRAMQDMRSAGLNPMLAYSQGGASSPVGSSYRSESTGSASVSSAIAMRALTAQIDKTRAEAQLARSMANINQARYSKEAQLGRIYGSHWGALLAGLEASGQSAGSFFNSAKIARSVM